MSMHTPGPWIACDNNGYSIWRVTSPKYRAESASRTVAEVVGDSAETEANAHLIAAAPEMYELMCTAVRFLQTASQYHPLTVTEEKWEQKALELMAEIEGGGE